jgi:hypothetical protein
VTFPGSRSRRAGLRTRAWRAAGRIRSTFTRRGPGADAGVSGAQGRASSGRPDRWPAGRSAGAAFSFYVRAGPGTPCRAVAREQCAASCWPGPAATRALPALQQPGNARAGSARAGTPGRVSGDRPGGASAASQPTEGHQARVQGDPSLARRQLECVHH